MAQTKIAIFKNTQIRKTIHRNEWWFSVIDVVDALAESNIPRRYWSDLKIKLKKEGFIEVYEKIVQLKLEAPDGKLRETDCANIVSKENYLPDKIKKPKVSTYHTPGV